ncbi:MAG: cation:proton antiporter [Alphaproteobacteria bacterium]|nr:cation:proton antiporter [Alphaproteobacteria bacterium]
MNNGLPDVAFAVFVIGAIVVSATLARPVLDRFGLPDVVGYIVIGMALSAIDYKVGMVSHDIQAALNVLAAAGVIILLFRVGLESNPAKLIDQLPNAGVTLIGSIVPSGLLGYLAARYLIGTDPLPALFAGVALTATSVGVSISVWRELGAIDTDSGALLLDLAELDDMAAIVMLAALLSIAPLFFGAVGQDLATSVGVFAGWLVIKMAALIATCLVFARYFESRVRRWLGRIEGGPAPVISVAGIGFMIAALAGWLGFSLAVGALFAGLAFSRDSDRVKLDRSFETLYRFFVPFFFVGIGLSVEISILPAAVGVGAILLLAAVIGKVAGTALPVLLTSSGMSGLLIGTSMVPRAEIAMIVIERGRALGDWAVTPELYTGMVIVTLGTCLISPPVVRYLLLRFPQR